MFSLVPAFFLALSAVYMNDWQEQSSEITSDLIVQHSVGSLRDNVAAFFSDKEDMAAYMTQLVQGGIWSDPTEARQFLKSVVPMLSYQTVYQEVDAVVGGVLSIALLDPAQAVNSLLVQTTVEVQYPITYLSGYYNRVHQINFETSAATFHEWSRGPEIYTSYSPYNASWMQSLMQTSFQDYMYNWTTPVMGSDGIPRVSLYFRASWPFTHLVDITLTVMTYFQITYRVTTLQGIVSNVPSGVRAAVYDRYTGQVIAYNLYAGLYNKTVWEMDSYFARATNLSAFIADPATETAELLYPDVKLEVSSLTFTYSDGVEVNFNINWLVITAGPVDWPGHGVVSQSVTTFFQTQYELKNALQYLVNSRLLDDQFDVVACESMVLPLLVGHSEVDSIQMTTYNTTYVFYVTNSATQVVTEVQHNYVAGYYDPLYTRYYYRLTSSQGTPPRLDDWTDGGVMNWLSPLPRSLWFQDSQLLPNNQLAWFGPWDLPDDVTEMYGNLYYRTMNLVFRVPWPSLQGAITNGTALQVSFRLQIGLSEIDTLLDNMDVGVSGAACLVSTIGDVLAITNMLDRPYIAAATFAGQRYYIWQVPEFTGLTPSLFQDILFLAPCANCTLINDTDRGVTIANGNRVYGLAVTPAFYLYLSLSNDLLSTVDTTDKVTIVGLIVFVFVVIVFDAMYFFYNIRNFALLDAFMNQLARHNPNGIRGLSAATLSTNNELRMMEKAILKLKSAVQMYLSYLPHRNADVADEDDTQTLMNGLRSETQNNNNNNNNNATPLQKRAGGDEQEMAEAAFSSVTGRRYSVVTSDTLDVAMAPAKLIYVTIAINNLQFYVGRPAFNAFFKRICDYVVPKIKMTGGYVVGFHHGSIHATWDIQKPSDTLLRNVTAQCVGCIMSLADDFEGDVSECTTRLGYEGVTLNIAASGAASVAGNLGSSATRSFCVFGRSRYEVNTLLRACRNLQLRYLRRSVVLVDDSIYANLTGRVLCREVVPGKMYNPTAYDPGSVPSEDFLQKAQLLTTYDSYYAQRVSNGPLRVGPDFEVLRTSEDAISRRLVRCYEHPSSHNVAML